MKYIHSFFLLICINAFCFGQHDIWSTFKYTDGIAQVPSLAGFKGGSLSLNQQWMYAGLSGAPVVTLGTVHSSFNENKLGAGLVFNAAASNVRRQMTVSLPLAYHLDLSEDFFLSFGLMPSVFSSQVDAGKITNEIIEDQWYSDESKYSAVDLSFSSHINYKIAELGFSVKNISNWQSAEGPASLMLFSTFYIPLKDEFDLLEPSFILERTNAGLWRLTAYTYYAFFERLIVGVGYKSSASVLGSVGYSVDNRLIVGYQYINQLNALQAGVSHSHEITFRLNFNQRYHHQRKFSILAKPRSGMSSEKL